MYSIMRRDRSIFCNTDKHGLKKEVYYETNHLGIFFGMDSSGVLLHPI